MIDVRTSLFGACKEIARLTCKPLLANSLILCANPLVETVMCRAPIANPLASLMICKSPLHCRNYQMAHRSPLQRHVKRVRQDCAHQNNVGPS